MTDQPVPGPNPRPVNQGWRNPRAMSGAESARGARRFWLIVLTGLFLAILAIVVAWLLALRAPAADARFLAITIDDYDSKAYPCVAFASTDRDRLSRHFRKEDVAKTNTRQVLLKQLQELDTQLDRPLIISMTALALVWQDKVHLLPADADPDRPETWVPVEEVLAAVERCKVPHKLLILDLARPLADARLGILSDRVTEILHAQLTNQPPAFFVLCPCSAGEFSLTSETLQASALAYYVDRGLEGQAENVGKHGRDDGAISVAELAAFVQPHVQRWGQVNRQRSQQPVLHGHAADFALVNLQRRQSTPEFKAPSSARPVAPKKGWELRDDWLKMRVHAYASYVVRRLTAQLLRQEDRWRGAVDREHGEQETLAVVEAARNELAKIHRPVLPACSLALAVPEGKRLPELSKRLQSILPREGAPEKKDEKKEDWTKNAEKIFADYKDLEAGQRAWAVVDALGRSPKLPADQVRRGLDLARPGPGYVETLYLRWAAAEHDRLPLLKAMQAREGVLAQLAAEPALLPWVADAIENADNARHEAERSGGADGTDTPARIKAIAETQRKYAAAGETIAQVRRMRQAWDDACLRLPWWQGLLVDWPDDDREALSAWREAAAGARELSRIFVPDEKPEPALLNAVDAAATRLSQAVEKLDHLLAKRVQRAEITDGPLALEQIDLLLATGLLTAKQRESLGTRAAKIGASLQNQTEDRNAAANGTRKPSERPERRAQLAVELLALGGLKDLPANVNTGELPSVEGKVKIALGKSIFEEWQRAATAQQADLCSRIAPPLESAFGPLRKHPVERLRNQQWNAYLGFMAGRCRAESEFFRALPSEQARQLSVFFETAGRDFARQAVKGQD